MTFDWTVSLGNLLTVFGFAASGIGFVILLRSDINAIRFRLDRTETILQKLSDGFLEYARREGRFEEVENRLNIVSRRLDDFISTERNR